MPAGAMTGDDSTGSTGATGTEPDCLFPKNLGIRRESTSVDRAGAAAAKMAKMVKEFFMLKMYSKECENALVWAAYVELSNVGMDTELTDGD